MIVSGASSIVAGSSVLFTLDRAELLALIGEDYYKEEEFWSSISFVYKHQDSSQYQALWFDFTADTANNSGNIKFSTQAKLGVWDLVNIVIYDRDRGRLTIERSGVPNVETYSLTTTSV